MSPLCSSPQTPFVELKSESDISQFSRELFSIDSVLSLPLKHQVNYWRTGNAIINDKLHIFLDLSGPDWSIAMCAFLANHGPGHQMYQASIFCRNVQPKQTQGFDVELSKPDQVFGYKSFYTAVARQLDLYTIGFVAYGVSAALHDEFWEAMNSVGITKHKPETGYLWLLSFGNDAKRLEDLASEKLSPIPVNLTKDTVCESDIPTVVGTWAHNNVRGVDQIFMEAAKLLPSTCIRATSNGSPIAWSLSSSWGGITSTFVIEAYRKNGYAKATSLHTAHAIAKGSGISAFAGVEVNNLAGRKAVEFMVPPNTPVPLIFCPGWKVV